MGSVNTVKIYNNILSNEERIFLLEKCKPFLFEIEDSPGLQTYDGLHRAFPNDLDIFEKIKKGGKIDREIKQCWMNYTDINFAYEFWHDHVTLPKDWDTYDYSCCYMIENPENLGTWFRLNDEICKVTCLTNSVIVFHKSIIHTVPPNITKPRYSIAMNFY